jgi:hypothetical protein
MIHAIHIHKDKAIILINDEYGWHVDIHIIDNRKDILGHLCSPWTVVFNEEIEAINFYMKKVKNDQENWIN